MAERVDKTILSFEPDMQTARKAQQVVSNISKEYERLKQQAAGLQEQFRTQGQAANYVAAQIADLEDAYRRGEISQQAYIVRSQALADEQQALDAAFASTVQSLSQTDNSIKAYIKSMATAKASTEEVNAALEGMRNEANDAKPPLDAAAEAAMRFREASKGAMAYRAAAMDIHMLGTAATQLGIPGAAQVSGLAYTATASMRAIERLPSALGVVTSKLMEQGAATRALTSSIQQYIPGMSAAAAQTTVMIGSLAAMGVALAGLGIAIKTGRDIISDSAEATRNFVDVNRKYAELVATGTTKEIEEAIQKNQERNRTLEIEREMLARLVQLAKDASGFEGVLLDINDALGLNLGGIEDAKDRLNDVNDEIANNISLNTRLEEAMRNGVLAASDYAERLDWVAEQVRMAGQRALEDMKRRQELLTGMRQQALTADDPEAVAEEVERLHIAFQESIKSSGELRGLYDSGLLTLEEYREAQRAYLSEQNEMIRQMHLLETVVMQSAQANQDAADIERTRKEAAEDFSRASQEALSIEQRRTALLDQYAEREEQIAYRRQVDDTREAEDWARRQMKARAQLNDQLIELDRKALEDRDRIIEKLSEADSGFDESALKLLTDYQKREKRATVDYWRDMAKINRDERRSVLEAAAGLDARAVWAAQRAAEDQRKARTEQFEEEKTRRAEDYEERLRELEEQRTTKRQAAIKELRDLEEKHRTERAARIAASNKQAAEEAQERAIRQRRMKEDRAYEDALRRQQFQNELTAINQLSFAAQALLDRARALAQATGGVGTTAYMDELKARSGKYVIYQGQKVRVDMYDPAQSGGMSASQWYLWKQKYGYQRGGYPPVGKPFMVGERGPEWMQLLAPARIYPHGQYPAQPSQYDQSRTVGDIHITVNEAFDARRTAQAVRQELMAVLTA